MKTGIKRLFLVSIMCFCVITNGFTVRAQEIDTADSEVRPMQLIQENNKALEQISGQVKAPAPQLTQMYVYAVYSDDGGLEYINQSPSTYIVSTTNDHGGNALYVYVVEIGYAGTRTATFNGNAMTLNDMASLDLNSDSIVDGYLIEWMYTAPYGFTTGLFSATSRSINFPNTERNITNFRIR